MTMIMIIVITISDRVVAFVKVDRGDARLTNLGKKPTVECDALRWFAVSFRYQTVYLIPGRDRLTRLISLSPRSRIPWHRRRKPRNAKNQENLKRQPRTRFASVFWNWHENKNISMNFLLNSSIETNFVGHI